MRKSIVLLTALPLIGLFLGCMKSGPVSVQQVAFENKYEYQFRHSGVPFTLECDGAGTAKEQEWGYDHPMGRPQGAVVNIQTKNAKFDLSDHDQPELGLSINGKFYPVYGADSTLTKIAIDRAGNVKETREPRLPPETKATGK